MVFPILAVAAAGLSMAGSLASIFGGKKKLPKMPDPVLEQIRTLSAYPPGPERDRLIQEFSNSSQITRGLYNDQVATVPGAMDDYVGQSKVDSDGMRGTADQLASVAGNDPYMGYASNPYALRQQQMAEYEKGINAAFGDYGSAGSEMNQRMGLLGANAAQRGIFGSGVARRQQEQEQLRNQTARQEALSKASTDTNKYLLDAGNMYNQARGTSLAGLTQSGQMRGAANEVSANALNAKMKGTSLLQDMTRADEESTLQAEKQGRDETQQTNYLNWSNAQEVDRRNAERKNQFALGNWQAQANLAMSTPTMGEKIGGALSSMGSSLGSMGGMFGGGGGGGTARSGGVSTNYAPVSNNYSVAPSFGSAGGGNYTGKPAGQYNSFGGSSF